MDLGLGYGNRNIILVEEQRLSRKPILEAEKMRFPEIKTFPFIFLVQRRRLLCEWSAEKLHSGLGLGINSPQFLPTRVLSGSGSCVLLMGSGGIFHDFRVHEPSPRSEHLGIIS